VDLAGQPAPRPPEAFALDRELLDPGGIPLFPGASCVLVRSNDARVDREHPLDLADRVVLDDHFVEDPVPGAIGAPAPEPFMAVFQGP
jgi:hypothetical protein